MKEWVQPEFNNMFDKVLDNMDKIQDLQYENDDEKIELEEILINNDKINKARREIAKIFEDMETEIKELYKETKKGDYKN